MMKPEDIIANDSGLTVFDILLQNKFKDSSDINLLDLPIYTQPTSLSLVMGRFRQNRFRFQSLLEEVGKC